MFDQTVQPATNPSDPTQAVGSVISPTASSSSIASPSVGSVSSPLDAAAASSVMSGFADPLASTSSVATPTTPSSDVPAATTDPFAPASSTSTTSATPAAPVSAASPELLSIKQEVLASLSPLVNHLDQSPEEKFRTTMMMIQASDDQSLIRAAYDAAKQITDEKARAQALLDIVNEINYFTSHHAAAQ